MDMKTKVPLGTLIVALPLIGVWYLNDYKIAQADDRLDIAAKYIEANKDRSLKNEQNMAGVKEDISAINQTMQIMQGVQQKQSEMDVRQTTILESIQSDLKELKRADRFGRTR